MVNMNKKKIAHETNGTTRQLNFVAELVTKTRLSTVWLGNVSDGNTAGCQSGAVILAKEQQIRSVII
jgi:hypothetical protein